MLFHVTHRHNWETCPLNSDDPAGQVEGMKAVAEGNDQVTVHGSWMDAPAHKGYMIIEADNAAAIMTLCMPLVALGEMEVVPVSEFGEISAAALAAISEQ
mgnify:FL=1